MAVYLSLAFAIIGFPFLFVHTRKNSGKAKKITCISIFIMMLLVMGLRNKKLGMYDIEYVYLPMFHNVQNLTFIGVFQRYPFLRGNLLQLITKVFTLIIQNEHAWIFATSIPGLACLTHLIMKYGSNRYSCAFSFFMFMGLRLYGANFYLVRHSCAMAMIIMAFEAIMEKRPVHFLLFVVFASWFHTTALLFVLAYPLARIRISYKQLFLLFVGWNFATSYASDVLNNLFGLLNSENYYTNYIGRNGFTSNIFIIITVILFITTYLVNMFTPYLRNNIQNMQHDQSYLIMQQKEQDLSVITINMLCIAVFFMSMSTVISEFQRIAFWFLAVSLVGIGNTINRITNKLIRLVVYCCFFGALLIFMSNALEPEMLSPYYPFWKIL